MPFFEMSFSAWRKVIDIALHGTFHCAKVAHPALKASMPGGRWKRGRALPMRRDEGPRITACPMSFGKIVRSGPGRAADPRVDVGVGYHSRPKRYWIAGRLFGIVGVTLVNQGLTS